MTNSKLNNINFQGDDISFNINLDIEDDSNIQSFNELKRVVVYAISSNGCKIMFDINIPQYKPSKGYKQLDIIEDTIISGKLDSKDTMDMLGSVVFEILTEDKDNITKSFKLASNLNIKPISIKQEAK